MLGVASIAAAALQPAAQFAADRRSVLVSAAAATISVALPVNADEAPRVLTDAEMEARVARKMELLRKMGSASAPKPTSMGANGGLGEVLAGSSRSDYNPEAAVNLRSRSVAEYADGHEKMKSTLAAGDRTRITFCILHRC